jgi:hypothetical protein
VKRSVTCDKDGLWYRYELYPLDLAVHVSRSSHPGITVVWRGRLDIDNLIKFFEVAAWRVATRPVFNFRVLLNDRGLTQIDSLSGTLRHLTTEVGRATFVEFECLAKPPTKTDAEAQDLMLTVFANLDPTGGTNLDNCPEAVGVYVNRHSALPQLFDDIAHAASRTRSHLFPEGHNYNQRAVLECLHQVYRDTPQ